MSKAKSKKVSVSKAQTAHKESSVFPTTDKAAQTADSFENFVSRIGVRNDNALSAGTYNFNLVTRNRVLLEAAYRGSWVVGAVIDNKADDMTRAGVDITTNEAAEKIQDIQAALTRLQIFQSVSDAYRWGDLYGGSIGVLQIKGQKLDTPLDYDTIGQDQFEGIAVYDRWQLNPDLFNVIESGPDIGLPKFYSIVTTSTNLNNNMENATGQIKVHHSRCIRFSGIKLPYMQAITEMMWGESVIERLYDRLIAFDNATMSSASLIDRANLRTVGIENLREIIAAGGKAKQGLESMFEMMRLLQVNEGLTLLDKNDTFASTAYSFAGLSDMMLQFGQQLSGATGIPLVRLFGQSPAGLSATGEADLRNYYDNINALQNSKLRNPFIMIFKVLYRSMYGQPLPKDFQFKFSSLWQMTPREKAETSEINTRSVIAAYESTLVDRPTSMKELRQNSGDTGIFSNITDEQILEAESDEPPMPIELENPIEMPKDPQTETEEKPSGTNDSAYAKIKKWLKK